MQQNQKFLKKKLTKKEPGENPYVLKLLKDLLGIANVI